MSTSKGFKVLAGLMLIIALAGYSVTVESIQGSVVFLMASVIFLIGFFAGEDI